MRVFFTIICLLFVNALFAQRPDWMDEDIRALQYPSSKYLVGFASGNILPGENVTQATERIKNTALGNLLESVWVSMASTTSSVISSIFSNGQYEESEQFNNQTLKNTFADIVGMKSESFFDRKKNYVYVFSHAKRVEVVDYHKNLIQFNLSHAESLMETTNALSAQSDKASARSSCEEALSLFPLINSSQSLLIALGCSAIDIQQDRSKELYRTALELKAQLNPKYEALTGLGNELMQRLMQIESSIHTGRNLARDGEKAKARQQIELAQSILSDVRRVQDSIRKVDPSASVVFLQQEHVEMLNNEITLLSAQLAQAIIIIIDSNETALDKPVSIIANRLKAKMALDGCSFTDDVSKADFKLTLTAETTKSSATDNFVFCYANVSFDFFDIHKQRSVYSNSISEKGGSTTMEKSARKAMENAADRLFESIEPFLQ